LFGKTNQKYKWSSLTLFDNKCVNSPSIFSNKLARSIKQVLKASVTKRHILPSAASDPTSHCTTLGRSWRRRRTGRDRRSSWARLGPAVGRWSHLPGPDLQDRFSASWKHFRPTVL